MNPLRGLARITYNHPKKSALIAFVVTAVMLVPSTRFSISTDFESMFDLSDPEIQLGMEMAETFGEQSLVTIVVDSTNSSRESAIAFADKLGSILASNEKFMRIQWTKNLEFFYEHPLLYGPEEMLDYLSLPYITTEQLQALHEAQITDMGKDYLISDDGRILLINTHTRTLITDPRLREELFKFLEESMDEVKSDPRFSSLDVGFTGGLMVIDYEGDKMASDDFINTLALTLVLIVILLFASFRSISVPLLALVPLLMGVIWTTGFVFIVYGSLTLLTLAFAVLIVGLGVDFAIHLLTRYVDEMSEHADLGTSIHHTFVSTGKAVVIGCLTTVAAFMALNFADTKTLHEMGVIAGVGMIMTMVAMFVVLPPLIVLRARIRKTKTRNVRFGPLRSWGSFAVRHRLFLIIIFILVIAILALFAKDAKLNENINDLMPTNVPSALQLEKVKAHFEYDTEFLGGIVYSEGELVEAVSQLLEIDGVRRVESILDFLPPDQSRRLERIAVILEIHPEFRNISWFDDSELTYHDLPDEIRASYVSNDDSFLIKIYPDGDIWEESLQASLVPRIKEVTTTVTGEALITTRLLNSVEKDVLKVTVIAVAFIFVIIYIGFGRRSPMFAILAMIPVGFGVLALLGTYDILGGDLNFISIMMIPLIVGIGIDDGVHIIHRHLEGEEGGLPGVIMHVGKAIFLTSATTCIAFGTMIGAKHPSIRSLGLIPVLGIGFCFVGSIVFLPPILAWVTGEKG